MRLIDADALDLDHEVELADDWKTAHEIANCVKYAPTVPAVPLDELCEWLEKNACYYQAEDNGGSTRFSLDSCQWKIALAKWMEEQDAAEKDT